MHPMSKRHRHTAPLIRRPLLFSILAVIALVSLFSFYSNLKLPYIGHNRDGVSSSSNYNKGETEIENTNNNNDHTNTNNVAKGGTFYEMMLHENKDQDSLKIKINNDIVNNKKLVDESVVIADRRINDGIPSTAPSIDPVSDPTKIASLLTNLIHIVGNAAPSLGFQLKEESSYKHPRLKNRRKLKNNHRFIERVYGKNGIVNIAAHDTNLEKYPMLSKQFLLDCLFLPDDLFKDLQKSHDYFVNHIPNHYQDGTYHGDGIVLIGGGKFSWLALLSVENLRLTGSKLPVEIIIPQREDYERQLCEVILPKLNARCVPLYNFINLENPNFHLTGYQLKSISLLVSSFQNVLFLDSDNIPVSNPDYLFASNLFEENGMVLWPDFWRRVTHPKYYDLAGYQIGTSRVRNFLDKITPPSYYTNEGDDPDTDFPFHDRDGTMPDLSTESGQILVNKKTHFKSLLLSFYYNVYGPRHYYPLFSQGGKGEGDKETFYAASQFFKLPVYQVNKAVGVIGHWDDSKYHGVGMIQYDPVVDYENESKFQEFILDKIENSGKNGNNQFVYDPMEFFNWFTKYNSKPMFVHSNYPKIEPIDLLQNGKLVDDNDMQWRLYADQPDLGFDFELQQWDLIHRYFCSEITPLRLKYMENAQVSYSHLCEDISARLMFLKSTSI